MWFGTLQAGTKQIPALKAQGLTTVTLELGWDAFEPQPGKVNAPYVAAQQATLKAFKSAGFRVILDTGLQYPPSWVFNLPGGTRFINQYGAAYAGGVGANLVNAVFNPAVRQAESTYYSLIAASFPAQSFDAVRVGGLNMGELSYPPPVNGPDTFWMYDSSAQAGSPDPGWRPGTGDVADAQTALKYYFSSIDGYTQWLLATTARAFPSADLQLMLPSWGLRPGQLATSLAAGLNGTTPAELNGYLTQGLDWTTQVSLLQPYGARGVAYTTWLDAPSSDNSPSGMSPAAYLHTLTSPLHVGLAGENTGQGSAASMALSLSRVKSLGMRGMMWMNASDVLSEPSVLTLYSAAAH